MLSGRLKFSGVTLAEVGKNGVLAINAQLPSVTCEVQAIDGIQMKFKEHRKRGNAQHQMIFTVSHQFKTPFDAEEFEFMQACKLANLAGGDLEYWNRGKRTYLCKDAQFPLITNERIGVSVHTTFNVLCGKLINSWRICAYFNGVLKVVKINLGDRSVYPMTKVK